MEYVILCIKKRTFSPLCREHNLSSEQRKSMSSSVYTIFVIYSYHTCIILTQTLLCTDMEYVILCIYREEDTLCCVENTISPPCGEGVCQNHAIRKAHTEGGRPQVKRYTILVTCYYYTRIILTHKILCTEMQHVIQRIEKMTLSSV